MLKSKYTSKTEIPEGLENYYSEKDGDFILQVEGINNVASVTNLIDTERKLRREAEAKVVDFEKRFSFLPDDFDADQFAAMKDKSLSTGEIDNKLKEQRESIYAQHQKELSKLQEQLTQKDELVSTHVKSATLQRAMAEAGVAKQFMPAVEAMMKDKIKVEGTDVYLNEKPVSEALRDWASSDDGKHYVAAPSNSGGGTHESSKSNGSGKREIKRSEFDAMPSSERMAATKQGITLID